MTKRGKSQARLRITIEPGVLPPGPRFSIGLGRGGEKHLIRISTDAEGLWTATPLAGGRAKKGAFVYFVLPPLDQFPDCKLRPQEARFELQAKLKTLLVTLPAWAWSDNVRHDTLTAVVKGKG